MSTAFDFGSAPALTSPRNKAWSNWAKFEKIGDSVEGYIRDVFYKKPEGMYKEARGITLEQPSGELINVSIKRLSFILAQTDNLRLGDPLKIVYERDLPSKTPGFAAAKDLQFYGKELDENKSNRTVAELEAADKIRSEGADKAAEEELNAIADEAKKAAETPAPQV